MQESILGQDAERKPKDGFGFIYAITSPDGRCYIGQTTRSPKYRWRSHVKDPRCCLVHKAIRSFGYNRMTFRILEECPISDLDRLESEYIKILGALHPSGYNMTSGGNQSRPTDIVKKKLSESHKRSVPSEDLLYRIGRNNMSIKIMTTCWDHSKYSGATLLVLLAMADWASEDGYCYPSTRTLAKKCRITRRSVQTAMRQFEKDGVIKIVPNAGPHGVNVYIIDASEIKRQGKSWREEVAPQAKTAQEGGEVDGAGNGADYAQYVNIHVNETLPGLVDVPTSQPNAEQDEEVVEPSEDKPSFNFLTGVEIESRTERQTVLECSDIWKSSFGILNVGLAFKVLRPIIAELGHEKTVEALKKYCAETKREHQPTLFKFSNVAVAYAREPEKPSATKKIITIQEMVPE